MTFNTISMEEALETIIDYRGKTPHKSENGIMTLSARSVKDGYIDYSQCYFISKDEYKRFMRRGFPQVGDVLLTTEAPLGVVARLDRDDVAIAQRLLVLRGKEGVLDTGYLYYYLKSRIGQAKLKEKETGTTVSGIKQKEFRRIEIKIPDYRHQKTIASILHTIDERIRINRLINQNLEQQIEAILLNYMDDKDADLVKLGDYLYIKGRIGWKGLKKSEYLSQSEYRIINGESLTKAGIDWNKAGYISEERYVESPEIMLQVGDILLSKDGTIGKIGYVDNLDLPCSVASGIFVIRNNKPDILSTTFIYFLLKSKLFESFIVARTEGSVIPHLYQKDFMEFVFPLPSSEKMIRFKEITEPMFTQIISNLGENKRLGAVRDVLVPRLISGELDVSKLDV